MYVQYTTVTRQITASTLASCTEIKFEKLPKNPFRNVNNTQYVYARIGLFSLKDTVDRGFKEEPFVRPKF